MHCCTGGFLTDNSRFNKDVADVELGDLIFTLKNMTPEHLGDKKTNDDIKSADLKNPVKKGEGIVYTGHVSKLDKDKNKIIPDVYTNLRNITLNHKNNTFKVGDVVIFNNEFLNIPLVFVVKPQRSYSSFEKTL